jgi:hypothetical protein
MFKGMIHHSYTCIYTVTWPGSCIQPKRGLAAHRASFYPFIACSFQKTLFVFQVMPPVLQMVQQCVWGRPSDGRAEADDPGTSFQLLEREVILTERRVNPGSLAHLADQPRISL